jgi:GNAT superfamily N-acetyltransferase
MRPDRTPLFCGTDLAERIERAEAGRVAVAGAAAHRRLANSANGFMAPLAGGVACFAEPDSPFNKVAGLGFGGVPGEADLDRVERSFAERGSPVQVELAHLGDPAIGAALTERDYRLVSFENVLGLSLHGGFEHVAPSGIDIRPGRDDDFEPWLAAVSEAFTHPDVQGVPTHEEFPTEVVANATRDLVAEGGVIRYVAEHDGIIVGGASFGMLDGVAQFAGAATVPAYRRRGVQSALLAARLAAAAAAGCDIAVVTTRPASKSQQNAQRQGFALLYTRAILVKQP